MSQPIRVYVGSTHSHRLMVEVLAWSIQRHCPEPVQVQGIGALLGPNPPLPRNPKNRPATPFSFQRFAVPELAGHQGRAIYMDADQLVLRDVRELFNRPMWGMRLQARPSGGPDEAGKRTRSSVMLLDCARLDWTLAGLFARLDDGSLQYRDLMALRHVWLKGCFPRHWNSLDHYEPGRTGLLHYTRRRTQPWVSREHPQAPLWFEALFTGLDAGKVQPESVEYTLANGFCRPSIRWQVQQREVDPTKVPAELHAADAEFYAHCERNRFNNLDGEYRSD